MSVRWRSVLSGREDAAQPVISRDCGAYTEDLFLLMNIGIISDIHGNYEALKAFSPSSTG
jgi:hypothetical protein